ncbi:MAG TPA: C25 family cysteine peptidase, partial [Pirellulaceae bacterium]|nr:C25 family cysteine peptidase [Pirellulaceae bacterium]
MLYISLKMVLLVALAWQCSTMTAAGQDAPVQMTIVGPRCWLSEMNTYSAARRPDVVCHVVAWEDLVEAQPGTDEPEKIKRYLYEQWKQSKIDHVLLIGDASVMPVRYMVLDRVTPAAHDYAFYASDLYYADLAKSDGGFENWNGVTEGFHGQYFGEVRGEKHKTDPINYDQIDYRPEIGVGRWPVRTIEEFETIAGKSLEHERQIRARSTDSRTVGFISVDGWIDSRPSLDLAAEHLTGWTIEKRYYADRTRNDLTAPPSASEVKS